MHHSEPGLFDLPDPGPKAPPLRSKRGSNRETWACTAIAEVTIVDAAAVHEALARAEANGVTIDVSADSVAEDAPPAETEGETANRALDSLAWLIWPTDGLDAVLEAGAFRIISVDSEVVGESPDRGTATWTVTVKITDVDRLRRLATQAHPDEAALVADSLAAAWTRAADPFAPLRSIPGIAWRPVKVVVEHLPARTSPGGG
ncbi:MAG: hypothetical protein ACOYXW_07065 [Actinomycetota bacterium]